MSAKAPIAPRSSSFQRAHVDNMLANTFALKAALRKSMLRTLRAIPEAELIAQSQAVMKILLDQSFFSNARTIACYLSMAKGELRTDGMVKEILGDGSKALFTPYLPPAAATFSTLDEAPLMHMLQLHSPEDLSQCPLDKWGILDPGETRKDSLGFGQRREDIMDPTSPPLDLVLLPGVAFDKECNRLGRGKAYYDRFLTTYTSARQKPLLIALALTPQLIEETVPTTEWDFTLDGVISPAGIVWRQGVERTRE